MRYIGYFILLILIIIGVTFAVLNSDQVTVNYYFASRKISLSLLLVAFFAAGVVLSAAVMLLKALGLTIENNRLRRQIKKLSKLQE